MYLSLSTESCFSQHNKFNVMSSNKRILPCELPLILALCLFFVCLLHRTHTVSYAINNTLILTTTIIVMLVRMSCVTRRAWNHQYRSATFGYLDLWLSSRSAPRQKEKKSKSEWKHYANQDPARSNSVCSCVHWTSNRLCMRMVWWQINTRQQVKPTYGCDLQGDFHWLILSCFHNITQRVVVIAGKILLRQCIWEQQIDIIIRAGEMKTIRGGKMIE